MNKKWEMFIVKTGDAETYRHHCTNIYLSPNQHTWLGRNLKNSNYVEYGENMCNILDIDDDLDMEKFFYCEVLISERFMFPINAMSSKLGIISEFDYTKSVNVE